MKLLLSLGLVLVLISSSFAADSDFQVQVKIVGGIGLLKVDDLVYDDVTATAAVQPIKVDPDTADPNGTPAQFTVTGTPAAVVDCTITGALVQLDNGGGANIPIGDWRMGDGTDAGVACTGGAKYSPTLAGGAADVFIGATITVGAWQTNGDYTGDQTLTVIYQ
ncbi:MAG: DUF4402 domain-containing protein [Candidatus Wallbacteria bacterium]|nr:DUF4402 domain-containing protein [Candidatus Wallbacteria bacterium]